MVHQGLAGSIVLVTGAAGFIGFHVCRNLIDSGAVVVGLDNLNDYYDLALKNARLDILRQHDTFSFERVELADADQVAGQFARNRPRYVIHLAAQAGVRHSLDKPFQYINSNITGFLSVLEACRAFPVEHLVYASSSSVYGLSADTPFLESQAADEPVSLYAATKRANELMAHSYAHLYRIRSSGLRFFTVYGPWGRPDMAYYKFTKAMMESTPIDLYNDGEMERDFTYIDDVVTAVVDLTLAGEDRVMCDISLRGERSSRVPHKIFNIGNHTPIPLQRLVSAIEACTGRVADIRFRPMQPGDVVKTYASVEALRAAVNYSPNTTIEEGIARFVEWYRAFHRV